VRKLEWISPSLPADALGRLDAGSTKAASPRGSLSEDISTIFGSGQLTARERWRNVARLAAVSGVPIASESLR
jgi:hypothetical protein